MEVTHLYLVPELGIFSQKNLLRNMPDEQVKNVEKIYKAVEKLEKSFVLRLFCCTRIRMCSIALLLSIILVFTVIVPTIGIITIFMVVCCPHTIYNRLATKLQVVCGVFVEEVNSIPNCMVKTEYELRHLESGSRWALGGCCTPPNVFLVLIFKQTNELQPVKSPGLDGQISNSKKRIITANKRMADTGNGLQVLGSQRSLNASRSRLDSQTEKKKAVDRSVEKQATDRQRRINYMLPILDKLTYLSKSFAALEETQHETQELAKQSDYSSLSCGIQEITQLNLWKSKSPADKFDKRQFAESDCWPESGFDPSSHKIVVSHEDELADGTTLPVTSTKIPPIASSSATPKFGKNSNYTKLNLFPDLKLGVK